MDRPMIQEVITRRSIRKYTEEAVSMEEIRDIVEAARLAPSGKNRQPWKFYVFLGEKKKELVQAMKTGLKRESSTHDILPGSAAGLADAYHTLQVMKEAPCLIVVINTNGESALKELHGNDERFREQCDLLSIGAAVEHMVLEAEHLGLGTLWIGNTCFAYPELEAYLQEREQIVGAVAVGHAAQQPKQRPRKSLEEIMEVWQ